MTVYEPANQCVYCGECDKALSDEHIIPLSLGGTLLLPKASCSNCANVTKKIEQTVSRNMYWPYRTKYNFPTRRKKERPKRFPVIYTTHEGTDTKINVPVQDHPNIYIALHFPEPGLITGAAPSTMNPEMRVELKGDKQKLINLMATSDYRTIQLNVDAWWGDLCRLIAKISHCYAYATLKGVGYVPLLPDLVLGKNQYLSHYVGGVGEDDMARITSALALRVQSINGERYVVVWVQLLHKGSIPAYKAVAGKVTDLDPLFSGLN